MTNLKKPPPPPPPPPRDVHGRPPPRQTGDAPRVDGLALLIVGGLACGAILLVSWKLWGWFIRLHCGCN